MPLRRRSASNGFSWLLIASMAGGAASSAAVRADGHAQAQHAQKQSDDADLLEFLGSIGSEDERWIDYLAKTDPAQVASATKPAPAGGDRSDGGSDGSQKK